MSRSRYFIDIHSACERGDLEEVKRYLQAGGDIEKKKVTLFNPSSLIQRHLSPLISSHLSQDGDTPLLYACAYDHTEVALFLIEKGASINYQNSVRVACP
jgi:ankyrin repeat protein